MKLALRALLVLAILVIGYLGVGLVVAAQLSAPSHHPQELTPHRRRARLPRGEDPEHRRARACGLVGAWE